MTAFCFLIKQRTLLSFRFVFYKYSRLYPAHFSILKVLAYYHIFNYPLTKDEIVAFLDRKYTASELEEAFDRLVEEKMIFQLDEFYSIANNSILIKRRKQGNKMAMQQMKTAEKVARLLSHFPYVRFIGVSGSLSKNFADEKSDIDLFIITAKNRLWIARTIMHLFKKLTFLVGKQNWFCMNYYVDEAQLEIEEKNVYTATEIITIKPLQGDSSFHKFILSNDWYKKYFPLYTIANKKPEEMRKGFFKRAIEWLFNNKMGDRIDNWLMQVTAKRWQKKTLRKRKNTRGILMSMKVNKHYSKPNPEFFQEKIVTRYNLKVGQLKQELEMLPIIQAVHAV